MLPTIKQILTKFSDYSIDEWRTGKWHSFPSISCPLHTENKDEESRHGKVAIDQHFSAMTSLPGHEFV